MDWQWSSRTGLLGSYSSPVLTNGTSLQSSVNSEARRPTSGSAGRYGSSCGKAKREKRSSTLKNRRRLPSKGAFFQTLVGHCETSPFPLGGGDSCFSGANHRTRGPQEQGMASAACDVCLRYRNADGRNPAPDFRKLSIFG